MSLLDKRVIALWAVHKSLVRVGDALGIPARAAYQILRAAEAIDRLPAYEDQDGPPPTGTAGAKAGRLGKAFEDRVRKDLLRRGWGWVLRSHMSKGAQDLIAFKPCADQGNAGPSAEVLFVQCKRDGACPPVQWNALFDLAARAGACPVLAVLRDGEVVYFMMTDRKSGTDRAQPMVPCAP